MLTMYSLHATFTFAFDPLKHPKWWCKFRVVYWKQLTAVEVDLHLIVYTYQKELHRDVSFVRYY